MTGIVFCILRPSSIAAACIGPIYLRDDYQSWWDNGAKSVSEVAAETVPKRLSEYTQPPIDEGLEQALVEFVNHRKKQFF